MKRSYTGAGRLAAGAPSKRRSTSKRGSSAGRTLAQKVMSLERVLGVEKKFIDYEYDAVIVETVAGSEADPATALSLTATAQGDGESNRDGRQVRLLSCHLRGEVQFDPLDQATPGLAQCVRILVVLDKQTNGAQFNAEDVLADPANADLDVHAFRNLQYTQRFRVLKDFTVRQPAFTAVWDSDSTLKAGAQVPFKCNIDLGNMPVTYTGTSAAIASIADNSIHVLAIASTTSTGSATLKYISRVRFVG